MKRLIIAAAGLALVGGIIIGGIIGSPFGRTQSTNAAVGQRGESQILLFADGSKAIDIDYASWQWIGIYSGGVGPFLASLDSANYPAGSTVQLEAVMQVNAGGASDVTACVRLTDGANGPAISGTETCHTHPSDGQYHPAVRIRSQPVSLPSGEHEYSLQGEVTGGGAYLTTARIIVQWTNPSVVGGVAEPPDLATGTGASGMGGGAYALLVGGVAFAVMGILAVKRRGVQP